MDSTSSRRTNLVQHNRSEALAEQGAARSVMPETFSRCDRVLRRLSRCDDLPNHARRWYISSSTYRLAVAPAKWKLEFKEERYRRLPLASCSPLVLFLG
jgi:hypothetical protein